MGLIEVKLRPTGPWRAGHRAGDRERVDVIYHSDQLYSAITHAMSALGWMNEWLDVTARATSPAVRFSSLFPYVGKTRLITLPRSGKLAPLNRERQPDQQPYTVSLRSAAAVDRLTGAIEPHRIACLEFAPNAGMWGVFEATSEWEPKVRAAFRLLADSGFGGERAQGWGRSQEPIFSTASALFPDRTPNGNWWVLGLFSPAAEDRIDWTKSEHTIAVRGGWTDSQAGASPKKLVRMIEEGSVLAADELVGRTIDVAPDGFPHPVYRNGQPIVVPEPAVVGQGFRPAAGLPPGEPESEPASVEPETPSEQQASLAPESPSEQEASSARETAPAPDTPAEPEMPSEPEMPAEPETPAESEMPAEPEMPSAEPAAPSDPEAPAESETPSEPHHFPEPAEPTPVEVPDTEPTPDPAPETESEPAPAKPEVTE